ncbi:MAG: glycerophosphodiester phosphodiesterase, partial [Pseudomonadales bacterium]
DVLEMDVHATRDGALVLMHDDAVDRTTNGTGRLADMDLATVQSLDAAYHWPFDGNPVYRGKGVRVPLLADVLERFPRQRFNIEIKADSKPLAEALCGVLHQTAREPVALVASFHRTALQHFRTVCPDVATSTSQAETTVFLLFSALWLDRLYRPVAGALQVPLERFGIPLSSEAMIASAARHGMYLDVWTLNGEAAIEAAYARGVSGVITDRPDLAMAVRNRLRVEGVSAGGGDP